LIVNSKLLARRYAFWLWLSFEKPRKHPAITIQELKYIEKSLGDSVHLAMPTLATTPWREFATSMPVYAIIVANFCRSWNFYLLVLYQSAYLKHMFDFRIEEVSRETLSLGFHNDTLYYYFPPGWLRWIATSSNHDHHCALWWHAGRSSSQNGYPIHDCRPKVVQLRWIRHGRILLSSRRSFEDSGKFQRS
jgi:hypothetical protein